MPFPTTRPKDLTIGSDIEYFFVKKGKRINAMDAMIKRVGTDHSGRVGEIRPQMASSIEQHTKNIQDEIEKVIRGSLRPGVEINSGFKISSTPCGGHIHFGIRGEELIEKCKLNLNYWLALTVQPLFPKEIFLNRLKT